MDTTPAFNPNTPPQPIEAEPLNPVQAGTVPATAKHAKPPRKVVRISASTLPQPTTLHGVIDLLVTDDSLTPVQRRDRISAITRACAFADTIPAAVEATPQVVTKLLEPLNAAYCGIEHSTFLNMISLVRSSIDRYREDQSDNRPSEYDFSPPWANLIAAAPEPLRLIVLRRGMRFFDQRGWLPEHIDREKFDLFFAYLTDNVIIDAKRHVRNSVGAWNRAVRTIPGWPQNPVKLETPGRRFTLDWVAFPPSLRDDFAAYIKARSPGDDLTEDLELTELKASSANTYQYYIRVLASALVLTGTPIKEISSLSVLVNPVNAQTALKFFIARRGNKKRSPQTHAMSLLLLKLAGTWCKSDEATIKALSNIHGNCGHIQVTLTQGNLKKLHMLADPHIRAKLYDLPDVLQREAERTRSPELAAYRMQDAISIEFLLQCPIRIGNLCAIEMNRHFVKGTSGSKGRWFLRIPAHEVKNGVAIDSEMDSVLIKMITTYREKFRPNLEGAAESDFLFPRPGKRHVLPGTRSASIGDVTERHLGVRLNPHVFRHIAATHHIEDAVGEISVAQKILGHKSELTTAKYYAAYDRIAAGNHFQEMLLKRRSTRTPKGRG